MIGAKRFTYIQPSQTWQKFKKMFTSFSLTLKGEMLGMRLADDVPASGGVQSLLFDDGSQKGLGAFITWCCLISLEGEVSKDDLDLQGKTLIESLSKIPTVYKTKATLARIDNIIANVAKQDCDARVQPVSSFTWSTILRSLSTPDSSITFNEAIAKYNNHPDVLSFHKGEDNPIDKKKSGASLQWWRPTGGGAKPARHPIFLGTFWRTFVADEPSFHQVHNQPAAWRSDFDTPWWRDLGGHQLAAAIGWLVPRDLVQTRCPALSGWQCRGATWEEEEVPRSSWSPSTIPQLLCLVQPAQGFLAHKTFWRWSVSNAVNAGILSRMSCYSAYLDPSPRSFFDLHVTKQEKSSAESWRGKGAKEDFEPGNQTGGGSSQPMVFLCWSFEQRPGEDRKCPESAKKDQRASALESSPASQEPRDQGRSSSWGPHGTFSQDHRCQEHCCNCQGVKWLCQVHCNSAVLCWIFHSQ